MLPRHVRRRVNRGCVARFAGPFGALVGFRTRGPRASARGYCRRPLRGDHAVKRQRARRGAAVGNVASARAAAGELRLHQPIRRPLRGVGGLRARGVSGLPPGATTGGRSAASMRSNDNACVATRGRRSQRSTAPLRSNASIRSLGSAAFLLRSVALKYSDSLNRL